jgi:molybdopterin-guanine dinucleotide biosynthesis protein A
LDIGYVILAGGQSKRLGRDKIKEIIGDKTLLERVISTLSVFNGEVTLVLAENSPSPDVSRYPQVKIVRDLYPGKGMIGGIVTGLSLSRHDYNLVVAADMPFLNSRLLRFLVDITDGNDLVAYRKESNFEPLHAVYSRNCLPILAEVMQKNLRIIELAQRVKVRYLTDEELTRFDPDNRSFFNINTAADLDIANKISRQNEGN